MPEASPARLRSAKTKLLSIVRKLYPEFVRELEEEKRRGATLWEKPDFIWEALLGSMATMGDSRGKRLVEDVDLHQRVVFSALGTLSPARRFRVLENTMRQAEVRWYRKKARWLADNFSRLVADGGPEGAKQTLESCPGREAMMRFLRSFRGIGEKYARNVMMDAFHPCFRESIAFDARLKNVSAALGVQFSDYRQAEEFFLDVAHQAELSGWELDRLIYKGYERIKGVYLEETGPGKHSGTVDKDPHRLCPTRR